MRQRIDEEKKNQFRMKWKGEQKTPTFLLPSICFFVFLAQSQFFFIS